MREKRNERLEGIKADSIVRSIVDDGAQLVDLSRQLLVFLGAFCAGITGFSPSVLLLRFFFGWPFVAGLEWAPSSAPTNANFVKVCGGANRLLADAAVVVFDQWEHPILSLLQ